MASTDSLASSITTSENEKQYKTLSCRGYVTQASNNCGYIAVWSNGLHFVYFLQPIDRERIKQGSVVHVTAYYSDEHSKYNAISVEKLDVNINNLPHDISSIGVVVAHKRLILMDITTGLGVRILDKELTGTTLICHDLLHFKAVLDPDARTHYKAKFKSHSGLKSPQFGVVTRVPTRKKAGEITTICDDNVMPVTLTYKHILPVKKYQRLVFDADIDVNTMKLGITAVEVLELPSKPELERKEAKGVVVEVADGKGMIMDTTDFLGVSFDGSLYDFPVGCKVVYSAKLQDPASATYKVTNLSRQLIQESSKASKQPHYQAKMWEMEAVEHLKRRLEQHESIPFSRLHGHWQQTSEAVKNELKDIEKCRAFLTHYSSIFTISETDEISLRVKERNKLVEQHLLQMKEPDVDVDLEQEAVNYLVKCLEKHKVIPRKNLSGYLSQASHEVQQLLNCSPDHFLERHSCFFKISGSGEISLRNFGAFTITPDLEQLGLIGGVMDAPNRAIVLDQPRSSPGNGLLEGTDLGDAKVPQGSKWDTGKTVDMLFGPSSQTSPRQGKTPSKPVKLLSSWEVSARQFMEETLKKYEKIYLMNLHSHVQYAPEHIKTRLRGQDAQRRFLLEHPDLFRIDDADLITLRQPQVECNTEDPKRERTQSNDISSATLDEARLLDVGLPLTSQESTVINESLAKDTSCNGERRDAQRMEKYVKVMNGLTLRNIPVTQLEYEALKYIAAKFEKHEKIERRKIFGHFAQAGPSVKPIYSNPQRADAFISKFPGIFKDCEGYLSMAQLYFRNSGGIVDTPGTQKEEIEKPAVQSQVFSSTVQSQPEIEKYLDENMASPGGERREPEVKGVRCVTVLGSTNYDILVTELEYDALKYIESRFKLYGTIDRNKLSGHFAQSPDHVRATYQNQERARSLVEKFPDVFIDDEGVLKMARLGFHESNTSDMKTSVPIIQHHDEKQKHTDSEMNDSKLSESISNYSETADHGSKENACYDRNMPETRVEQWEIEAKAFIASKLVKHKQIYLRNLHSHFAGASRSMCHKLSTPDKQREFFANHADLFSIDKEDVITLFDKGNPAINSWPQSTDSVASSDTGSESQHRMKEFVGVGQIICLFEGGQTGLVKDMITDEVLHLKGKHAGFKNNDLLNQFSPDCFVAFRAGPRATGVTHPNGILNMKKVEDSELNFLKTIAKTLQETGPMNQQDLMNKMAQIDKECQKWVSSVKALEQFLRKHSILFNVSPGSVSLRCQENAVDPPIRGKPGEKWFKAIVYTRNGQQEDYLRKSEFLVMQHVRKTLQGPENKVEFSKLHELFLESPGPGSNKLKSIEQAREFVQKHPDIFQVDGDKVSMARVSFTQRKGEIPAELQGHVSASSASVSVADCASVSTRGSTRKTRHDSEELIAGTDYTSYQRTVDKHQVVASKNSDHVQNDGDSMKPSARGPRVVSGTWGSIDEFILAANSSESNSENTSCTASESCEALSVSSVGIGKVISVYPRNGHVQDVFTDVVIILLQALIQDCPGESLSDHFCIGDYVEYDSVERVHASKYKRGVAKIQKIEATDLECVSHVVKCLREVDSMTIDALLVYLNEASDHPLSQPCTIETLSALVQKYNMLFAENDGMVMLNFEVSEDALEWIVPESCSQPQDTSLSSYDVNTSQDGAATETLDNNRVTTSQLHEPGNTVQKPEGKDQSTDSANDERQTVNVNECTTVALYHKPLSYDPELVIEDDLDDLETWDDEEFDPTKEQVFVPHLTEESLKSYESASGALGESGISANSWHTCTEQESESVVLSSTVDAATNEDTCILLPKPTDTKTDQPGEMLEIPPCLNDQQNSTSELHLVPQNSEESEPSSCSVSSGSQTIQPDMAEVPVIAIQKEVSPKQPQVEAVIQSDSTSRSPVPPGTTTRVSTYQHPESGPKDQKLESRLSPRTSNEASLVWQNHQRIRSELSGGVSEGLGTICAVLVPAVVVLMEDNQVGVFTMPAEQCIMPKLDSGVRYMARKVESKQTRWTITDLFFEHHIISAFGSAIENNSMDIGVQTDITGHIIGCRVFEQ